MRVTHGHAITLNSNSAQIDHGCPRLGGSATSLALARKGHRIVAPRQRRSSARRPWAVPLSVTGLGRYRVILAYRTVRREPFSKSAQDFVLLIASAVYWELRV